MWWMDTEGAFRAWNQAIEEAGLSWKDRQERGGEWNTLESLGDARYRKQGATFFATSFFEAGLAATHVTTYCGPVNVLNW
jgi:hypothetical protein